MFLKNSKSKNIFFEHCCAIPAIGNVGFVRERLLGTFSSVKVLFPIVTFFSFIIIIMAEKMRTEIASMLQGIERYDKIYFITMKFV